MDQSERPTTELLTWGFASAGVYIASGDRFRINRRRFAEFPGWYLIDSARQQEMRLDTLERAQRRALWLHNQNVLNEPSTEDMISAIDNDFFRGLSDGPRTFAGLVFKTPGYLSIDYCFAGGIITYRHSKKSIVVKVYFDDGSFEIVSKSFEREALKSSLSKWRSSGAFDSISTLVRAG